MCRMSASYFVGKIFRSAYAATSNKASSVSGRTVSTIRQDFLVKLPNPLGRVLNFGRSHV
jgi:hypothetical protein